MDNIHIPQSVDAELRRCLEHIVAVMTSMDSELDVAAGTLSDFSDTLSSLSSTVSGHTSTLSNHESRITALEP